MAGQPVQTQQQQGDTDISPKGPLDEYLEDPEYANWVKSGLALNITNEVLRPFVVNEITKLHRSIIKKLPCGVSCPGCRVNTSCPNGICDKIQNEIEHEHWYPEPSFTNTCTGRWCTEPWEIAKCFMPSSEGSRNISPSDADFTASISVIINCKHFQAFGINDPRGTETDLSKSRKFRNSVMHASPQKISEKYMTENLNILIKILNMVKTPETEADTQKAIKKIKKIKTNELKLKLEDVIEVRKNATEATADKSEKEEEQVQRERLLVNFETGCRKALCRITEEHIRKQTGNLSVAGFLSKIDIFAGVNNLGLRHKEMLFPTNGTHADITEWDLFVYCFILEEIDVTESLGNADFLFVQEVKKIRDRLLLDATAVTQNDLSDLCEYLIVTELNTEITEIFNKDSPDVDVIRSNNILVSWWRDEEDYGNKPVSNQQLNYKKQIMKEFDVKLEKRLTEYKDIICQEILEKVGYKGEHVTLQGACTAVKIDAECELKVRGCDKKTEEALQEDITSSKNNNAEKREGFNHFCDQRNLLEVEPVEGSIILNVKCSSITNVLDFWDSCIDGRAVAALSKVRDYYRRYYNCDTLEFDVILSKKGVSRCVNEIVESLPYHFKGLIDEVTNKVQELLEDKEKSSLSLPKVIDVKGEEERIKHEKEIEEDEPLTPGSVESPAVVGEGWDDPASSSEDEPLTPGSVDVGEGWDVPASSSGNYPRSPKLRLVERPAFFGAPWSVERPVVFVGGGRDVPASSSEKSSLSLPKVIDVERERERIKQEKHIEEDEPLTPGSVEKQTVVGEGWDVPASSSGDSVTDINKKTRGEVDRLVKYLRQISEDLEGGGIASIKQHLGDITRYSKENDEKMFDECNRRFVKHVLKSGLASNLISQAIRGFHMIRHDPGLGDLVKSEIDLMEKEERALAEVKPPVSEAKRSERFGGKGSVLIEEDIKVEEMDIHARRPSKHQERPTPGTRKSVEKDLISKHQLRAPITSQYGHGYDEKMKLLQTSQELTSVESEPGTSSKLYTKPKEKPVD